MSDKPNYAIINKRHTDFTAFLLDIAAAEIEGCDTIGLAVKCPHCDEHHPLQKFINPDFSDYIDLVETMSRTVYEGAQECMVGFRQGKTVTLLYIDADYVAKYMGVKTADILPFPVNTH